PWGATRLDGWSALDRHGWLPPSFTTLTEEEHRAAVAFAFRQYKGALQDYHIGVQADRALRELLQVSRREGIGVVFVTMPEDAQFRSWYPPVGLAAFDAYLTELCREHGVCWVDARDWVSRDGFFDGHHLLARGATVFTERLGREVLLPLLRGVGSPEAD